MNKNVKRLLITVGIVIALFIPTYIAVISYHIINSLPEPINASDYEMSIVAPSGTELLTDSEELKELILKMRRDRVPCDTQSTAGGYSYDVKLSGREDAQLALVFFDDGRGYMIENGSMYELPARDVKDFLSSKYAAAIFPNSSLPTLLSESKHKILPKSASWSYNGYEGRPTEAEIEVRERTVTYNYEKTIGLSFTVVPDECTVKVKRGSETVYDGDLSGYLGLKLDETTKLEYEIFASWSQKGYSGQAEYHFFADLGKPAEFEVQYGKYDDKYLEFILVNAKNVGIPEDAVLIVEPALGFEPRFVSDGSALRALIPFGEGEKEGSYSIIASYGNVTEEFEFEYVKRPEQESSNPYPEADGEELRQYREGYLSAIEEIGAFPQGMVYMGEDFLDPEDPEGAYGGACSLLVGFGRIRAVGDGETKFKNDGVVYRTTGGVFALNAGKVIKTGSDEWLGKYVVIDHGLGLRTWYANLMSIDVNEGDTLRRGQALGQAGDSGFTRKGSYGFYLMVTVGDTPISPYALLDDGIRMN